MERYTVSTPRSVPSAAWVEATHQTKMSGAAFHYIMAHGWTEIGYPALNRAVLRYMLWMIDVKVREVPKAPRKPGYWSRSHALEPSSCCSGVAGSP